MKFKKIITLVVLLTIFWGAKAQYVNIPDANFRALLKLRYPQAFNSLNQMDTTHPSITSATIVNFSANNIQDLNGIQYFKSVYNLNCRNNKITSLSNLPASLTDLDCSNNKIAFISSLSNIMVSLNCSNNQLSTLPSLGSSLKSLDCSFNQLVVLPTLPSTLTTMLKCNNNLIQFLPTLPTGLRYLECSTNVLSALPSLPSALTYLSCSKNEILTLPTLPSVLATLYCDGNLLTSLPILPNSITDLNCSFNQIASLPTLPTLLRTLRCGSNSLTNLPSIPSTLTLLNCDTNKITSLPLLPNNTTIVYVNNNQLTNIINIPTNVIQFYCNNNQLTELPKWQQLTNVGINTQNKFTFSCLNNNIFCLPKLPAGPLNFNTRFIIDTGKIKCLPNLPKYGYPGTILGDMPVYNTEWDSMGVVLSSCNPTNNVNGCHGYPMIDGLVYNDNNSNGIIDGKDFNRANIRVNLQTGESTYTNDKGYYQIWADSIGSNTLSIAAPSLFNSLPVSITHNFANYNDAVTDTFALQPSVIKDSLSVALTSWLPATRPGGKVYYFANIENVGTTVLNNTITINFDSSKLSFDSFFYYSWIQNWGALPTSYTNTGNSLVFPITLNPGQRIAYTPIFSTKTHLQMNDSIITYASIAGGSATASDSSLLKVRNSYDPNDKLCTPELSPAQVVAGNYIDYTIRFQNMGNAEAINVVIADTLSNLLKNNIIQVVGSSHLCRTTLVNGTIYFEFLNINLPDDKTDPMGSQGFVRFRVLPQTNVALGTVIPNTASIYFDYNPPIVTNTATTVIRNKVLPVNLKSFTSKVSKARNADKLNVENTWTTSNEINTQYFFVQRSFNGKEFITVGTVAAKGFGAYNFTDVLPNQTKGNVYYRLKIADRDGKTTYSSTQKVNVSVSVENGVSVYPNPAKGFVIVEANSIKQINILDNLGRNVVKHISSNVDMLRVNTASLSKGVYSLQVITANGDSKIEKIVIE